MRYAAPIACFLARNARVKLSSIISSAADLACGTDGEMGEAPAGDRLNWMGGRHSLRHQIRAEVAANSR